MRTQVFLTLSIILQSLLGFSQDKTITIQKPTANQLADTILHIACNVTSPLEVLSVKAKVADREVTLQVGKYYLEGDLLLKGLEQGPLTLTITVTDVTHATFEKSVEFIYDSKPLVILESSRSEVARPFLRVKASCKELNEAPCSLTIKTNGEFGYGPEHVYTFGSHADTLLDFSIFEGRGFKITVVATDSKEQVNSISFYTFVEISPILKEVKNFNQTIHTIEQGKVITLNDNTMTVSDVTSGVEEKVPFEGIFYESIVLENGLAFTTRQGVNSNTYNIYTWIDNVLTHVPPIPNASVIQDFQSRGNVIYWKDYETLWSYNTKTETSELIAPSFRHSFSISSDGSIVYSVNSGPGCCTNFDIWLLENGVSSKVVEDGTIWIPKFDNKLVYYKGVRKALAMFDFVEETILHNAPIGQLRKNDKFLYFSAPGNLGQDQMWAIDLSTGEKTQLTYFGSGNTDLNLFTTSPVGGVLFQRGDREWYLASTKGRSKKVSNCESCRSLWHNGAWYLSLGTQLFVVDTVNYEAPSVSSVNKSIPYGEPSGFAAEEFDAAFSGDGVLSQIKINQLPEFGTLTLDGEKIAENFEIPRWRLSDLQYEPAQGFTGTDTFRWSASNGFDYTNETDFTVQVIIAGVATTDEKDNLTLYPNPARSSFGIHIPRMSLDLSTVTITLVNVMGKTYLPEYYAEADKIVANIEMVDAGLYFVKIHTGERVFIKKIIIGAPSR